MGNSQSGSNKATGDGFRRSSVKLGKRSQSTNSLQSADFVYEPGGRSADTAQSVGDQQQLSTVAQSLEVLNDENFSKHVVLNVRELQARDRVRDQETRRLHGTIERLKNENMQLEAERSRMLTMFQNLHTELAEMKELYRTATEQVTFFRNERDRVRRMFNDYQIAKESQYQTLIRAKNHLEQRMATSQHGGTMGSRYSSSPIPTSSPPSAIYRSRRRHQTDGNSPDAAGDTSTAPLNTSSSRLPVLPALEESCRQESNQKEDDDLCLTLTSYTTPALLEAAVIHLFVINSADIGATSISLDNSAFHRLNTFVASIGRFLAMTKLEVDDTIPFRVPTAEAVILVVLCEINESIEKLWASTDFLLGCILNPGVSTLCDDNRIRRCQTVVNAAEEIEQFLRAELANEDVVAAVVEDGCDHTFDKCRRLLCAKEYCPFLSGSHQKAHTTALLTAAQPYLDHETVFGELDSFFSKPVSAVQGPLLIAGPSGCGKTTLLNRWLQRLQDQTPADSSSSPAMYILHHTVALASTSRTADFALMITRFVRSIRTQFQLPAVLASTESLRSTAEQLKTELQQLVDHLALRFTKGVLIAVDGIDRLQESPDFEVTSWLWDLERPGCRIVLVCDEKNIRNEWRSWQRLPVSTLTGRAALRLMESLLPNERQFAHVVTAQLAEPLMRTPASLLAIASFLRKGKKTEWSKTLGRLLSATEQRGGSVHVELLSRLTANVLPSEYERLQIGWRTLGFLLSCADGLSRLELQSLIPFLSDESEWQSVMTFLMTYCGGVVSETLGLYTISNSAWRDAVATLVDPSALKEELLGFFQGSECLWRFCNEALPLALEKGVSYSQKLLIGKPSAIGSMLSRSHVFTLYSYICGDTSFFDQLLFDDGAEEVQICLLLGVSFEKRSSNKSLYLLERAEEGALRVFGSDSPMTALVQHQLACRYADDGQHTAALRCITKTLAVYVSRFGEDNELLVEPLDILSQIYKHMNRPSLAEATTKRLALIRNMISNKIERSEATAVVIPNEENLEKLASPTKVGGVKALSQLGLMRYHLSEYEAAAGLFRKAVGIAEASGELGSVDVADAYFNLANCQSRLDDWTAAELNYGVALRLFDELFGENDRRTTTVAKALLRALRHNGGGNSSATLTKTEQMERLLRRLIAHSELVDEPDALVGFLAQLAGFYCNRGQHDRAEPLLERAIAIGRQWPDADRHPTLLSAKRIYAKLQQDVGNYDVAIRLCLQLRDGDMGCADESSWADWNCVAEPDGNDDSEDRLVSLPSSMVNISPIVLSPPPPGRRKQTTSKH